MKKRVTFALDQDVVAELKTISDETMIPQSRLVEKAIEEVIEEEKKKIDQGLI
ncbi:ribbon-helix-helix domain-containing protein [Oenococcus sicerae]|uniref:Ribbon-helix-helix domain-containing protein n=1 Tax=Oenococcus sicerae TaxID=2203724 RepID=A0AAJ1RBN8_9LACO|nr:ribbon-helix-helix domain-containing protein [Oenococcus sicerae]MDN6900688.1 ribbon-helix-helix domain-containing protein [Oenococcus sicerae]QAS70590.1 ribbon-helix-helix domain-containing protein [Oenococcus sicerae]